MAVLKSTSLSIERLRRDGEVFMEELSREYYLAHSGQKSSAELQPVYERHAAILGPDALAMVVELFREKLTTEALEARVARMVADLEKAAGV